MKRSTLADGDAQQHHSLGRLPHVFLEPLRDSLITYERRFNRQSTIWDVAARSHPFFDLLDRPLGVLSHQGIVTGSHALQCWQIIITADIA